MRCSGAGVAALGLSMRSAPGGSVGSGTPPELIGTVGPATVAGLDAVARRLSASACQTPSNQTSVPSAWRMPIDRAKYVFGYGVSHRPGRQLQRLPIHTHSPSTQTARSPSSFFGMISGFGAGGGYGTTFGSSPVCGPFGGRGSPLPHPIAAAIAAAPSKPAQTILRAEPALPPLQRSR